MKGFLVFLILLLVAGLMFAQPAIEWQKSMGGSGGEIAQSIQQTVDSGYIIAGYSNSIDGDVSSSHGSYDYWIVKLDLLRNIEWQKSLGGSAWEEAYSVQQTTDGGYIVAGFSKSNDGDVTGNHGGVADGWIVKLDSLGEIDWQKCLGGSDRDIARSIQQTVDGGYIVAGDSRSNDGDVIGHHGNTDYWVVKLDSMGEIEWQNCLGGSNTDKANSVYQAIDGGYIVAGYSSSNNGDVSGNHGEGDYWIIKLSSSGSIIWQKSLGGMLEEDAVHSIQQTTDGGYIIAGSSQSTDGDVTGNHGNYDYWIVKLDSLGNLIWQKSLGGNESDLAYSIQQTNDNGYIIAGSSNSNNGDVFGNHGNGDFWIVKLAPDVTLPVPESQATHTLPAITISPNPFNSACQIDHPENTIVKIFDIRGQLVGSLLNEQSLWTPTDNLMSGIYFARIVDPFENKNLITRKIVYIR